MNSIVVLLPTRNRAAMLRRTLRSLERQTFKDFTVYVSDDASTDETRELKATDFPGVKINWRQRTAPLGGAVEHFNVLYGEVEEDWIALAHDDEIYAPDWMETLISMMGGKHESGAPIVLAFGHTVVVDARRGPVCYYRKNDDLPEGLYTGDDLKRRMVFEDYKFASNGFMVTRSAIAATAPMNSEYEQFDFEWLMRIAEQGITAVSVKLLQTYCMHTQNTVGSIHYLQNYFQQKNPSAMREEWLLSMRDLEADQKSRRQEELQKEQSKSRFRAFLKLVAAGNRKACQSALSEITQDGQLKGWQKALARASGTPVLFFFAQLLLGCILRRNLKKVHSSLLNLSLNEIAWLRN